MSRSLSHWLRLVLLMGAGLAGGAAQAHRLDEWLQATLVHLEPDRLTLEVRIAPGAALAAGSIAEIDTDGDGRFSAAEQAVFAERIHRALAVSIDGQPWPSTLTAASFPDPVQIREGTGDVTLQFAGRVSAGAGAHRLRIEDTARRPGAVYLVNALQPRAPSLQSLQQKRSADQSSYELDFTLAPAAAASGPVQTRGLAARSQACATAWTFFVHGLRHILTGYDHLLFAAALVLAVRGFKELLLVVTAFTLAHTLTSALAVYGLLHVPASVVEPGIAASIVVVALQNALWPRRATGRARLAAAFCFGLFHGLGLAGGLLDVMQALPASTVGVALLGFMLGVEAGQQLVVVPLFLLLARLRRASAQAAGPGPWTPGAARRWASGAIAASGAFYLLEALAVVR